jgi:hypothetical protein
VLAAGPPVEDAVAAFDNSPVAHVLNLTSVDLAFDRIATLAVQCVAEPSVVSEAFGRVIPVSGDVIRRESTASQLTMESGRRGFVLAQVNGIRNAVMRCADSLVV